MQMKYCPERRFEGQEETTSWSQVLPGVSPLSGLLLPRWIIVKYQLTDRNLFAVRLFGVGPVVKDRVFMT